MEHYCCVTHLSIMHTAQVSAIPDQDTNTNVTFASYVEVPLDKSACPPRPGEILKRSVQTAMILSFSLLSSPPQSSM